MSDYMVVIGRENGKVVYATGFPPNLKFEEIERKVETEFKKDEPNWDFEIICDKTLYDVITYFYLREIDE